MYAGRAPPVALVIEDEGLVRLLIVEALRAAGWLVHEAWTGESALNLFQRHHVDLVFTDIELGGNLNGWDVAETVRAVQPELPVIYTSGKVPDDSKKVSNSVFFGKPYDAAQIVAECQRRTARGT
jgi:CheY-like chemotaxis protein